MHTTMLGKMGPPYAMMPSYITAFQSSPVRICTQTYRHTDGWVDRQTGRQADGQGCRKIVKQKDTQTDMKRERQKVHRRKKRK